MVATHLGSSAGTDRNARVEAAVGESVGEPLAPGSRVAVVGAGIAGLTAAWILGRDCDLTVFEAGPYVGGHTNTVDVELDGRMMAVDTGFIVFNRRHYPSFCRMLDQLDVPSHESAMSFSVRCDRTGIEYSGTSLNTVFAQRRNLLRPSFLGMLRDITRFHREAPGVLRDETDAETVASYLERRRYGRAFAELYLGPIGASIWSCPVRTFGGFPIRFVVEFMRNHDMLQVNGRPVWRTITGGGREYVRKLTSGFRDRIRTCAAVRQVERHQDHVAIRTADGLERFDHVVLACHSDQALALLDDPHPVERELLGAFPYERNVAILHTDASVLPRVPRARAAWNYHRRRDEPDRVTLTYNMNILQSLPTDRIVNVSLNDDRIDESEILERFVYDHPIFTPGRAAAQGRHAELINTRRTSFCGAYWGYGFHEDGVRSALAVCAGLGRPWL